MHPMLEVMLRRQHQMHYLAVGGIEQQIASAPAADVPALLDLRDAHRALADHYLAAMSSSALESLIDHEERAFASAPRTDKLRHRTHANEYRRGLAIEGTYGLVDITVQIYDPNNVVANHDIEFSLETQLETALNRIAPFTETKRGWLLGALIPGVTPFTREVGMGPRFDVSFVRVGSRQAATDAPGKVAPVGGTVFSYRAGLELGGVSAWRWPGTPARGITPGTASPFSFVNVDSIRAELALPAYRASGSFNAALGNTIGHELFYHGLAGKSHPRGASALSAEAGYLDYYTGTGYAPMNCGPLDFAPVTGGAILDVVAPDCEPFPPSESVLRFANEYLLPS